MFKEQFRNKKQFVYTFLNWLKNLQRNCTSGSNISTPRSSYSTSQDLTPPSTSRLSEAIRWQRLIVEMLLNLHRFVLFKARTPWTSQVSFSIPKWGYDNLHTQGQYLCGARELRRWYSSHDSSSTPPEAEILGQTEGVLGVVRCSFVSGHECPYGSQQLP